MKSIILTCGQGARKSAAKPALLRAPLALTVFIDLSASDGEEDEIRVGEGGAPCAQMKNFHLGQCPPAHQGCVSHPRTLKATITLNEKFTFRVG